jgi:predicted enzyme related to lactoylglutathione lyase
MTSLVRHLTFDSNAPLALARFWSDVTGWPIHAESDETEALVEAPAPMPGMLFLLVPEGKTAKNRIHFDLQPQDRTRDEELARVLGLGAKQVADHRQPDGTGWVVLVDPEGNEFCVERSAAERG